MSHVFISYSRRDIEVATKIVTALAKNKLATWVDWNSIPKGEDWEKEIYRGIEGADAFLFLISPDSVESEMCNKEIDHAVRNGKRILPILIRQTESKNVPSEISKWNWIFCREGQDDFKKSINDTVVTIQTDYKWLKYHTQLQVKALDWAKHQDHSRLIRGRELQEAARQLAASGPQKDPPPTRLQNQFVLASQRNEIRIRRRVIISLAVGLAGMILLSIFAWDQRNQAISQKATAQSASTFAVAQQATAEANAEEARRQTKIAIARQLAAQAAAMYATNSIPTTTNPSQIIVPLLYVESLKLFPTYAPSLFFFSEGGSLFLGGEPIMVNITHPDGVSVVLFSPNGRYVASGSKDGTVIVWETATGQTVSRLAHDESVVALSFSPDNKYLASGSIDGSARVWEVASGHEVSRMIHDGPVFSVAFSPDGKYLVTGSADGTARVWEPFRALEIARMTHSAYVLSVAFSPDGHYVLSGSGDGTARVWKATTGKEVSRMNHTYPVTSVAFSPDGRYVVSAACDCATEGFADIWMTTSGEELSRIIYDRGFVTAALFSPDGKYILSTGCEIVYKISQRCDVWSARVWKFSSMKEIARMNYIHGPVMSAAFSPKDSNYVILGSYEATASVWDISMDNEVARMEHDGSVSAVAFSPDGKYVVSGSGDMIARLWPWQPQDLIDYACSNIAVNMTRAEWQQYIGDALPYQAICENLPIDP